MFFRAPKGRKKKYEQRDKCLHVLYVTPLLRHVLEFCFLLFEKYPASSENRIDLTMSSRITETKQAIHSNVLYLTG